jgi:DNA primase
MDKSKGGTMSISQGISRSTIDELKRRIDIGEVIGREIHLKKVGKDLQGLCPFHQDTRPSLTVSPGKGFYHCFACGAHGDAINFLMELSGRSFGEVVEELAERYSVVIERTSKGGSDWAAQKAKRESQDRLRSLMAMAVDFYRQMLYTPDGQPAREHLKRRGIRQREIADKYQLGWAGGGLVSHLLKAGYGPDEIQAAGLATNKQGEFVDFLWQRLVIPIFDDRGRAIALAGRVLDDREPKYLNTRETSIWRKTLTLYGLHHARPLLKQGRSLSIVEGYFDAIALNEAGIPAGAVMGVNLSADLATRLARLAPLVLILDRDKAGTRAARRLSEDPPMRSLILSGRLPLRVLELPEDCKDPDEAIRSHGPAVITQGLVEAPDYLTWLIALDASRHNATPIEARAQIREDLTTLLSQITAPAMRLERLRQMASYFAPGDDEARRAIIDEARSQRRSSPRPKKSAPNSTEVLVFRPGESAELAIARILLHQSSSIDWDLRVKAELAINGWDCYWPMLWNAIWDGVGLADIGEIEGLPAAIIDSLAFPSAFDQMSLSDPATTIFQAWEVLRKIQERRDLQKQIEAIDLAEKHEQSATKMPEDENLGEFVSYLKQGIDHVSKHPDFQVSDLFPLLKTWDELFKSKEQNELVLSYLNKEQILFWAKIREVYQGDALSS